jgi:hypothetical protein
LDYSMAEIICPLGNAVSVMAKMGIWAGIIRILGLGEGNIPDLQAGIIDSWPNHIKIA